jgi:hypothetical protein
MRAFAIAALLAGTILPVAGLQSADADSRGYRAQRAGDCRPYNGPFGFYGNIWCDPGEASYLRNLGAQWPQKVPKSLRQPKYSSNYEW